MANVSQSLGITMYGFIIGFIVGLSSKKIPAWVLTTGVLLLTALVIFLHWLGLI